MASISQGLPSSQSLGRTDEEEVYHEKNGVESEQRTSHDRATDVEDQNFEKDAPSPSIDYTDWNGDDDPDNPHNCTKSYHQSSLPYCANQHIGQQGPRASESITLQHPRYLASLCTFIIHASFVTLMK
jgi:hypothetical protein